MCDSKFIPGYIIEKKIGNGSFGDVWLARKVEDSSPIPYYYVVKKIAKDRMKMAEVQAGELLDHPNIVKYYSHFDDDTSHYLVLEYIEGMDLFSFMEQRNFEPLPEHLAHKIFSQLASAVHYCHQKGVAHRDLKLENVLIDPNTNHVKLIDLGLCKIEEEDTASCVDVCGSVDYISPEILEELPYSAQKSDVWSLGVILYCLLCANFPFSSEERMDALMPADGVSKKEHPPLLFPRSVVLSRDAKDLCRKMMAVDPSKRITMNQVIKHPWMQMNNAQGRAQKPSNESASANADSTSRRNNGEDNSTYQSQDGVLNSNNNDAPAERVTKYKQTDLVDQICWNFGNLSTGKCCNLGHHPYPCGRQSNCAQDCQCTVMHTATV
jgi:serine/threonine protein kinase